jgi:predicted metalloprotease
LRSWLRPPALGAVVVTLLLAACSSPGVRTLGAAASDGDPFTPPGETTAPASTDDPAPPTTAEPADPAPDDPSDPTDTTAGDVADPPASTVPGRDDELVNFGAEKQRRGYDDFVVAALNDVELWWAEQYPLIYGEEFEPLQGGIYAGYPERTDPIPGCGNDPETGYEELIFFAAFYCPDGDFIAYDDGEQGLLYSLTDSFGPAVMGVVLAHEYGHAIQTRAGVLDDPPPTIVTEQQADCFSGAWLARAVRGDAVGVRATDDDIRAGLIALIEVRDPIGIDQSEPGSHGSGFDRVGAFQVGYEEGPMRCAELVDNPLPLMPNVFVRTPSSPEGNSPYGYDAAAGEIPGFAVIDLNEFWTGVLSGMPDPFRELELVPFTEPDEVTCPDDLVGDEQIGTLLCPATRTVFLNEPLALERYRNMGDFAIGYMLGTAWSEAAQATFQSPLDGEDRALINDCLTGAWTQTLVPDPDPDATGQGAIIEPGDLDEAIQTALVAGDDTTDADVLGSAFEKIDSFRTGVLGGVDACEELLQD